MLTTSNFIQFTAQLKPLVCPKKAYYQFGSLVCDVYFEPEVVWEIKCADLSISPAHMAAAGLVDEVKVIFSNQNIGLIFYIGNFVAIPALYSRSR